MRQNSTNLAVDSPTSLAGGSGLNWNYIAHRFVYDWLHANEAPRPRVHRRLHTASSYKASDCGMRWLPQHT
eukprot:769165-Pleurochrysis_carterae.AAC.2